MSAISNITIPVSAASTITITIDLTPVNVPGPPPLPPTVAVTSPSAGSTISGSAVSLVATTSGSILGVTFFVDGVQFGVEDTVAPYSTTWNSTLVADGTHTFYAVARYGGGNITSATVSTTVNNTPVTTITSMKQRPFALSSPWNTVAPVSPTLTTISAPMSSLYANWDTYSVPVYFGGAGDPLVTYNYGTNWRQAGSVSFRCPVPAHPNATGDQNMIVIDTTTWLVHDCYGTAGISSGTSFTGGDYGVASGVTDSGFGNNALGGAYPFGHIPGLNAGCRAIGCSWYGGAVTGQHLSDGVIPHKLAVALLVNVHSTQFRVPAIWGDGAYFSGTGNVDEGDVLVIPAGTSMPGGLTAEGQIIWTAFINYGAIVVDHSGACNIYLETTSINSTQASHIRSDIGTILPYLKIAR